MISKEIYKGLSGIEKAIYDEVNEHCNSVKKCFIAHAPECQSTTRQILADVWIAAETMKMKIEALILIKTAVVRALEETEVC